MKKTADKNVKNSINESYNGAFKERLDRSIVVEIDINDISPQKLIWIPHRAVVRNGPSITIKMRVVYSCSLNEVASLGLYLLIDLFGLLNYFRS